VTAVLETGPQFRLGAADELFRRLRPAARSAGRARKGAWYTATMRLDRDANLVGTSNWDDEPATDLADQPHRLRGGPRPLPARRTAPARLAPRQAAGGQHLPATDALIATGFSLPVRHGERPTAPSSLRRPRQIHLSPARVDATGARGLAALLIQATICSRKRALVIVRNRGCPPKISRVSRPGPIFAPRHADPPSLCVAPTPIASSSRRPCRTPSHRPSDASHRPRRTVRRTASH